MFIANSQIFCVQSSIRAAKENQPLLLLPFRKEISMATKVTSVNNTTTL